MDIVESINRYLAGSPVNKGERTRLTRARDEIMRLRTSPQSSKPFVGLTDEEREQIRQRWATQNWMLYDIINAVDAKLREKNT